jgi:hypothetical protein
MPMVQEAAVIIPAVRRIVEMMFRPSKLVCYSSFVYISLIWITSHLISREDRSRSGSPVSFCSDGSSDSFSIQDFFEAHERNRKSPTPSVYDFEPSKHHTTLARIEV